MLGGSSGRIIVRGDAGASVSTDDAWTLRASDFYYQGRLVDIYGDASDSYRLFVDTEISVTQAT